MASIRAIYILTSDHKILFSRRFPTIENRLQNKMGEEYVPMNYSDRVVCNAFSNQVIKEELIQEEFKCRTYKEDLEIDHQKMEELIRNVDININVNNFKNYSECPIVTLNIQKTKIWPCLYIKKYKIYGVVFPNIDFEKFKSIRAKIEKEKDNEKNNTHKNYKIANPFNDLSKNFTYNPNQNENSRKNFDLNENININLNNIQKYENFEILTSMNMNFEDSQMTSKLKEFDDTESNNNLNLDLNTSNIFEINNINSLNEQKQNSIENRNNLENNQKFNNVDLLKKNCELPNQKMVGLNITYPVIRTNSTNQMKNDEEKLKIKNFATNAEKFTSQANLDQKKNKNDKEENIKVNPSKDGNDLNSIKEEEKLFKLKKLYEEQDVSIVGSITLMENLLNYIIASKSYEENKIHTLISNMVPFGNIMETNINFMLESLNFLNQRLFNSNNLFSQSEKKSQSDQEKIKIPGWVTKIPTHYSENLNITIKEELKYVKYGQDKYYNVILCDISCLAELSRNCEITLPIKESKTNFLGNLRIHPCAKLENQNILNDATRIIFIPPHDEFKMGVFEIENFEQTKLPIIANFCLKESAQNEVKLYLKVEIDENVISKFEYFYINIPLGHFGIIIDTKIMVQVGEVSLVNNKTTLHWDLQNKVFDKFIVLSGTVNYLPRGKEVISKEEKKEKNIEKENNTINKNDGEYFENKTYDDKVKKSNIDCFSERHINIEDITKVKSRFFTRSDIMSTNCFCKIHFKLNNFSLSNIDIDKKSLLFYPKLSPKIDIRRQFFSNDYIVWNGLSFYNNEITIPEKNDISLLKINVEEN